MPGGEKHQPPVGIDLGTTLSAVAYIDTTGRPTTIPNSSGDLLTPSAVAFEDGAVIVGKEAIKGSVLAIVTIVELMTREKAVPSETRTETFHSSPFMISIPLTVIESK